MNACKTVFFSSKNKCFSFGLHSLKLEQMFYWCRLTGMDLGGREGGMSPKIIHQSRWNQERRRQAPTFITGHHHPTINDKQYDALTLVDIKINVLIIVCLTNSDDAFVGTLMFQRIDKVFLCTIRFYVSVAFSYYFSDICVMTLPTTRNLNV
jgi:hypothetical protein